VFLLALLWVTLMNGYLLSYSFWMCAHPLYQATYWQIRFYIHLGVGALCILTWIHLLFRTLRNKNQQHRRQIEI